MGDEVEKFIYEYQLRKQATDHPELVLNMVKVSVRPKTYRRIGRGTLYSSTRVWFKEDEGKVISGSLILSERDDARALEAFVAKEVENVKMHEKFLDNAIERYERVKAITHAVEDEDF